MTTSARGRTLSSARKGVEHWKMQRLTSIAAIPLGLWLVISLVAIGGAGYADTRAWLASPFNTTMMILTVITFLYHAQLGLQVVIEDYVHHEGIKIASLVLLILGCVLLGALAIVSTLKVSLGS